MDSVNKTDLKAVIQAFSLQGKIICLHSSLKSFGLLAGGAQSLVDSFLESDCTLIVPTFNYNTMVAPEQEIYRQNGMDGEVYGETVVFDPQGIELEPSMGTVAKAVLMEQRSVRGNHPVCSFTGIGPKAKALIQLQTPMDVYAPYKALMETNAVILLMGVGLTRATPIHYAEALAGRELFSRWSKNSQGETFEVKVGSCSEGFELLSGYVESIRQTTQVGMSQWQCFPFHDFVVTLSEAIRHQADITHCSDPSCCRCHDSILGGPTLIGST